MSVGKGGHVGAASQLAEGLHSPGRRQIHPKRRLQAKGKGSCHLGTKPINLPFQGRIFPLVRIIAFAQSGHYR